MLLAPFLILLIELNKYTTGPVYGNLNAAPLLVQQDFVLELTAFSRLRACF